MRRSWWPMLIVVGVVLAFVATLAFLFVQARPEPEEVEIVEPAKRDIVLKTVATGAIVPRVEVEIKSRVSGVVDELLVEPGAAVTAGDLIARIQVIPEAATLAQAEADLRTAKIALDNAQVDHDRAESLASRDAISAAEVQAARTAWQLARQEYEAALEHLQIVREGATRGSGIVSTDVRSTVTGMVLAVDVEVGDTVTETNTFSAGTTIAWVADMTDMIFEGQVDESEVGRIQEGMPLDITVGAVRDRTIAGNLEYISPKGVVVEGTVQFEIRAAITPQTDLFIRAGSSANADIVLERRDQVLSIDESALRFDGDRVYVEVEQGDGVFEPRDVKVGLSDGLYIEVVEGITGTERLEGGGDVGSPTTQGRGRGGRRR
jgi:HlyD family secretion protein